LSLGRAEEQSNIDDSSNIDPTIMELSDDHDDQHEQDDGGPHYWSEVETWENYIEQSDILNDESKNEEILRCDTTLLVTGPTKRQHLVVALNNFEMFNRLGANEARLGSDDELVENRIITSKSALNWVIYDCSVRKRTFNVEYKKVIKHDLL
jgi:hypothetical protein